MRYLQLARNSYKYMHVCMYVCMYVCIAVVYSVVCNTITNNTVDLISYSWLIHISVGIMTCLAAAPVVNTMDVCTHA